MKIIYHSNSDETIYNCEQCIGYLCGELNTIYKAIIIRNAVIIKTGTYHDCRSRKIFCPSRDYETR